MMTDYTLHYFKSLLLCFLSFSRSGHIRHKISVGHGQVSHQTVLEEHFWNYIQGKSCHTLISVWIIVNQKITACVFVSLSKYHRLTTTWKLERPLTTTWRETYRTWRGRMREWRTSRTETSRSWSFICIDLIWSDFQRESVDQESGWYCEERWLCAGFWVSYHHAGCGTKVSRTYSKRVL